MKQPLIHPYANLTQFNTLPSTRIYIYIYIYIYMQMSNEFQRAFLLRRTIHFNTPMIIWVLCLIFAIKYGIEIK